MPRRRQTYDPTSQRPRFGSHSSRLLPARHHAGAPRRADCRRRRVSIPVPRTAASTARDLRLALFGGC
ncbi:MAG TPA: hypothetical protein VFL07_05495, partial [Rudaea sp.]|nr:hypothetical protein [Rudaea sp.]